MGEWKEKKNRAPDLKYLERESLKKGDSDTGTAADVELVMKKYDLRVQHARLAGETSIDHPVAVGIIFRLQHLCDAFQYRLAGNPVVDVSGNDSDSRVSALSDSEGRRTHQPYAVVRLGSDGSGGGSIFLFCGERACDH